MGSPISGTIAEIFLQHLEHTHIRPLIQSKQILYYTCYIDDIFIIYDTDNTNQDKLAQHTNSMYNNLQFNPTQESNGHINFLHLTIIRRTSHLETDIYRKPTTTDTTIILHPSIYPASTFSNYNTFQKLALLPYSYAGKT